MQQKTTIICPFCSYPERIDPVGIPTDWQARVICSKCFHEYVIWREGGEIMMEEAVT
ncbi:MAG: hypothetical protein JW885_02725 [Deltaproteobacteria bacterium]|nr:hypothetical protein [Candidatus Zymogenaceae bacterium]